MYIPYGGRRLWGEGVVGGSVEILLFIFSFHSEVVGGVLEEIVEGEFVFFFSCLIFSLLSVLF